MWSSSTTTSCSGTLVLIVAFYFILFVCLLCFVGGEPKILLLISLLENKFTFFWFDWLIRFIRDSIRFIQGRSFLLTTKWFNARHLVPPPSTRPRFYWYSMYVVRFKLFYSSATTVRKQIFTCGCVALLAGTVVKCPLLYIHKSK